MSEPVSSDEYGALLDALLNPGCYPHPVGHLERIETHISDVFLTGRYAYKLKKPVDLGFLDYSTLEKRRRFCHEELRLNRRLASELYLGVVSITGEPAHPHVGGQGSAIEYAVQMLQFDQSGMLERVIGRRELSSAQVDEIGEMIAAFHSALPPSSPDTEYGRPQAIMRPAVENFEQLLRLVARDDEECAALRRLQQWTLAQHARLEQLFEGRWRDGFVRECHGDLHLGNMVLIDRRIRIFDCIEFNAQLRWIDVMSEVAFLTMDLIRHERPDFAYRFLDRYLQITGDYRGVQLLRYYIIYRALVRAKVAAIRATQPGVDPQTRRSLREKCRAHVMHARDETEAARPRLVILHGLSGSGKTVVSQALLESVGAIRIRSDVERKRLHGMSPAARSESHVGAGIYTAQAGSATYNRLTELADLALDAGYPVLVDAAFLKRAQREQLCDLAHAKRVPFAILHTQASEATLRRRISQRAAAGIDASEASASVLDWQLANQEPLTEAERAVSFSCDTEREDPDAAVKQARQLFQQLITPSPDRSGGEGLAQHGSCSTKSRT